MFCTTHLVRFQYRLVSGSCSVIINACSPWQNASFALRHSKALQECLFQLHGTWGQKCMTWEGRDTSFSHPDGALTPMAPQEAGFPWLQGGQWSWSQARSPERLVCGEGGLLYTWYKNHLQKEVMLINTATLWGGLKKSPGWVHFLTCEMRGLEPRSPHSKLISGF